MKPHDFFNLLEGKIELPNLHDGVWIYPDYFKEEYNKTRKKILDLAKQVNAELEKMASLEKQQFIFTVKTEK